MDRNLKKSFKLILLKIKKITNKFFFKISTTILQVNQATKAAHHVMRKG